MDLEEVQEFAVKVARDVGDLICQYRDKADLLHFFKQGTELVTDADLAADQLQPHLNRPRALCRLVQR